MIASLFKNSRIGARTVTLLWWAIQVQWSSIITIRVPSQWTLLSIGILMGSSKNSWISAHWTKLELTCLQGVTLASSAKSMYWTSMVVRSFKIVIWCLHKVIMCPEPQVYCPTNNSLATNLYHRLVEIELVVSTTFSKVKHSINLYQALLTRLPQISKMKTYY